jgi:hypothetical protein
VNDKTGMLYLPLLPETWHPWGAVSPHYQPLRFQHQGEMARAGYAEVFEVFEMDWVAAECCGYRSTNNNVGTVLALGKESLDRVLLSVKEQAGGYVPGEQQ